MEDNIAARDILAKLLDCPTREFGDETLFYCRIRYSAVYSDVSNYSEHGALTKAVTLSQLREWAEERETASRRTLSPIRVTPSFHRLNP